MARKSSIDILPLDLRNKLISMLSNPAITQKEITDLINDEAGENVVSKSAVNRYAIRMQKQIEQTKQAREVAEFYMHELGEETHNTMGKVLNQQMQLIAFDLMLELKDMKSDGKVDMKSITDLVFKVSRGIKNLEESAKINEERERKIRKSILEAAAEKIEAESKKEGLSSETTENLKKELLGLI